MSKEKKDGVSIEKSQITLNLNGTKVVLSMQDVRALKFQLDQFLGQSIVPYPWYSLGPCVNGITSLPDSVNVNYPSSITTVSDSASGTTSLSVGDINE